MFNSFVLNKIIRIKRQSVMRKYFFILLGALLLFLPREARSTRNLWCWTNDSITNNIGTARTDLFNFCAAPFGDTTQAVTVLYYYGEGLIPSSDSNLRSFLQQAHAQGLKVLYMDGDPSWDTSAAGVQIAESFVTSAIVFNEQVSDSTQRFDGIEMDIEPASAPGPGVVWTGTQADTTIWNYFINILTFDESQVSTYNLSYSPKIYFESVIERNDWTGDGPVPNYQQVQNICDSVCILDYVTTVGNLTTQGLGEISYADSSSKKVVVGVETGGPAASDTFYGMGDSVMESRLTSADAVFSTHSSYQGNAIDDLDTYKNLSCSCSPIAYCWGNVTTGTGPLTVIFTDGSGNTPTSWNWSFGDGGTATTQDPSHIYASVANSTSFTVSLIVSNAFGSSTVTRTNYIQVTPASIAPSAGFYGNPTSGSGPLKVYFTDTSANNPSSWNWTFGNGSTSTLENPTTVYAAVANATSYNVTLVATNAYGSNTATYNNYISVSTALPFSGGIIWDFDTLSPATVLHQGYLYVYGYTNTNGMGGTNALQIDIPYKAAGARHKGEAIWMSNYAGFSLNSVSPYNGPIGNLTNTINLSKDTNVYFNILASNTSSFGVCFTFYDTTGNFFVKNGDIYLADTPSDSTTLFKFTNLATSTTWQFLGFNIANTHGYKGGHTTGTAPALTNIEAFEWFFSTSTSASGQGLVPNDLKIWIDNVGAISTSVPVELMDFEALESSIKKY